MSFETFVIFNFWNHFVLNGTCFYNNYYCKKKLHNDDLWNNVDIFVSSIAMLVDNHFWLDFWLKFVWPNCQYELTQNVGPHGCPRMFYFCYIYFPFPVPSPETPCYFLSPDTSWHNDKDFLFSSLINRRMKSSFLCFFLTCLGNLRIVFWILTIIHPENKYHDC